MKISPIECALSGIVPAADAIEEAQTFRTGPSGLPEGWTELRLSRRRLNPAWEAVQETKEVTIQQLLAQVEESVRTQVEPAVVLQIEAQFAALEARPEYAMTLLDEKVLYIAPSNEVDGLEDEIRKLCTTLDIDPDLILPEMDNEDEDDNDADETPAEASPEVAPVAAAG
jgi:hypothetical protein